MIPARGGIATPRSGRTTKHITGTRLTVSIRTKSRIRRSTNTDGACICGAEEPEAPHVHDYDAEVTEPTCLEDGYTTYTCSCGDSYIADATPKKGHSYSEEWSHNETHHWHAAVCEHTDEIKDKAEHEYVDGACICGAEEPEVPHSHDYNAVVTEPTCLEGGYTTYTCSCGDSYIADATPKKGHSYSEEWSYDETHHWHAAICEHTELSEDKAEHEYGENYVCHCGYAHSHTFSDDWSFDESKHWHASTCGHDVRDSESEHFIGADGACVSNCGYKQDAPHEHVFSTKWSHDETYHWHAAICEHTELSEDKAEHTLNDGNVCTECGYTKPIIIVSSDIAQGGWAYGTEKANTKRIRVDRLIPVKAGTVIRYDMKDKELYIDLADGVGSSTGDRVGWLTGAGEYLVQRDAYLGLTIAASGRGTAINPSAFDCDITIIPGSGEIEMTYEKVNIYKFGGKGNDWCFVYLPEGYDPDRAEPYPFVIANHGNGWTMNGSAQKANWTNVTMYMSAAEIAKQSASSQSRYIATEDESLWYSNPTIEAFLAAGYIVCGAQNYGDNLYGNDDCTDACVDFFNHMVETYNVEGSCYMIGASNGAMTTLGAVAKLGDKVKSIILQYPLATLIEHYLDGNHRDQIEAAYGLDTSKTYTKEELVAALGEYDVLHKNVANGVKQGYFPSVKIYYSTTDTATPSDVNAEPLMELLAASHIEYDGVRIDIDGTTKNHGHVDHFDPEAYVEWFEAH